MKKKKKMAVGVSLWRRKKERKKEKKREKKKAVEWVCEKERREKVRRRKKKKKNKSKDVTSLTVGPKNVCIYQNAIIIQFS